MNDKKWLILELCQSPISIKELQAKTGIKWANLSLILKDLSKKGLINFLGRKKRSKIIQTNLVVLSNLIEREEKTLFLLKKTFNLDKNE